MPVPEPPAWIARDRGEDVSEGDYDD